MLLLQLLLLLHLHDIVVATVVNVDYRQELAPHGTGGDAKVYKNIEKFLCRSVGNAIIVRKEHLGNSIHSLDGKTPTTRSL